MVCAFIPLFFMQGPEGQIFSPMADTYAFALGGALLLAVTLVPVLCLLFFRNIKPTRDNFLVRWLKAGYLEKGVFFATTEGTPQGGIISPALANATLDCSGSTSVRPRGNAPGTRSIWCATRMIS